MFRISTMSARVICVCCALAAGPVAAQSDDVGAETRYFYRSLSYGSDAAFHPVSELINGAFGVLQISSNWVPLDDIDWHQGFSITWESISHPGTTIDTYGGTAFVKDELVPARFGSTNLQYVPNYTLHLIGGGARNRAFAEWYGAHGFAAPEVWAFGTTILHGFAVEAVEHYDKDQPTVDPVADMLVFDPLGAVLFMSDGVSRFFSHTLNMSIWSGQPMYNPVVNTFENAGENYGLHFFFSPTNRVGIFSYWGMSHLFGVTVRGGQWFDWSIGVGGAVDELKEEDRANGTTALYARVKPDLGVFVHRNGSLLGSVQVSQAWTQALRVNVYPGWFKVGGMSPGMYAGIRGDDFILGLSFSVFPIGLAGSI